MSERADIIDNPCTQFKVYQTQYLFFSSELILSFQICVRRKSLCRLSTASPFLTLSFQSVRQIRLLRHQDWHFRSLKSSNNIEKHPR